MKHSIGFKTDFVLQAKIKKKTGHMSMSYRRSRATSTMRSRKRSYTKISMKEAIPDGFLEEIGISPTGGGSGDIYRDMQEKLSVEAVSDRLAGYWENLSCIDARKFYKDFQERLFEILDSFVLRHAIKKKHRCLCRSYIRWLARVLARSKTDASQSMCDPRVLESRDRLKYSCNASAKDGKKAVVCPPLEYLYQKYRLSDEWDDDDDRWEVLCESASRTNYVVDMATKAWNALGFWRTHQDPTRRSFSSKSDLLRKRSVRSLGNA